MFGLLKKSKPLEQDIYFPFKTVIENEQLIFDKKQFASNGFDVVQKQRMQKQKKRQNRYNGDKWVRSGDDSPFTKAKKINRDVLDQNELQTYASLEKMLHKAIHAIRQLKKKGNTNIFSASKQQCKSSSLSNSDLKTNEIFFDKSKAVKTTSKAHSTRCFKCHRFGHYANKCHKLKPLVTLEKVETEPEKEDSLPILFDQTQGEHCADYGSFAYNPFPFNVSDLRTNLFEDGGNDVPQSSEPDKTDMHGLIMESNNDICSLFDSYLPNHEASTYEITCRMCSTQLQSSSKKNQIKRSSDVGVMQFTNQVIFSPREFGPRGSSGPHPDPYLHGPERPD